MHNQETNENKNKVSVVIDATIAEGYPDSFFGKYPAKIESIVQTKTKRGERAVKVVFRSPNGRRLFKTFPVEGMGGVYFAKLVRAIKPEYITGPIAIDELVGKMITIEVVQNSNKGDVKNLGWVHYDIYVLPYNSLEAESLPAVANDNGVVAL